jgi:hypothetical protein
MYVPSNYDDVKQAVARMIEVLRKYKIRYVLDAPKEPYDWWLLIAIDIDDLYRTLCKEANAKTPTICKRTRDGSIYGVRVIADINTVKEQLNRLINEIPYRLHPDFAVDKVGDNEFIVAMKLYDDDVIDAMFRDVQHIRVEKVRVNGDLWVRVKFLSY